MFVICFSSLANSLRLNRPSSSGGYTRTGGDTHGSFIGAIGGRGGRGGEGQGRRRDVDAENRLIDQLDEEWDE